MGAQEGMYVIAQLVIKTGPMKQEMYAKISRALRGNHTFLRLHRLVVAFHAQTHHLGEG